MTLRNLYEAVLIELNKENAPNITLSLFNYLANKAVNLFVNKRYNIYDTSLQTTDDLKVLKATAMLPVKKVENVYDVFSLAFNATYEVILPSDYFHILNCICFYNVKKTHDCWNLGDIARAAARKLTADSYSLVLDNFWNRPTYLRPYYYIHNVNTYTTNPTNPYEDGKGTDVSVEQNVLDPKIYKFHTECVIKGDYLVTLAEFLEASTKNETFNATLYSKDGAYYKENSDSTYKLIGYCQIPEENHIGEIFLAKELNNLILVAHNSAPFLNWIDNGYYIGAIMEEDQILPFCYSFLPTKLTVTTLPNTINIRDIADNTVATDNVQREGGIRYGNVSEVRMEIRYGTDDSIYELTKVYVDYLKTPQYLRLTQKLLDYTEDFSQMLEYPDYVCQEIANELVHIIMENISDLRLLTHPVVSLSIAMPTQALAPDAAGQSA